jgi:hypothetical protein
VRANKEIQKEKEGKTLEWFCGGLTVATLGSPRIHEQTPLLGLPAAC